jgi:hypothetical protein
LTITETGIELTQLFASVPVSVKFVDELGETVKIPCEFTLPICGLQTYEDAPDGVKTAVSPAQIVTEEHVTTGKGFTTKFNVTNESHPFCY